MPKLKIDVLAAVIMGSLMIGCAARKTSSVSPQPQPPAVASGNVEDHGPSVVQAVLTEPGTPPFHLRAAITERADFSEHVDLEIYWVSPAKWRRTIASQEFSQTLVVNGDDVFEQDSDDYIPIGLQTLAIAVVDPRPILDAWRPGDQLITKANGQADESGKMCFDPQGKICGYSRSGMMETVGSPGHAVTFSDYRPFANKRVARLVTYKIDQGDSLLARVTTLEEMKNIDASLFKIQVQTPKEAQIGTVALNQTELAQQALQKLEIIWPQVLDGKTTGETSYFVSIDKKGQVREVLPLSVAIERADDSARRQIMRWKFKPVLRNRVPMQVESVVNFDFNTRAYGPTEMLTDAEARKLASNVVDPAFPAGTPSGLSCAVRVAVDSDGGLIEQIAGECAPGLFMACSHAVGKWKFSPIVQDGKSLPYRAEIAFKTP